MTSCVWVTQSLASMMVRMLRIEMAAAAMRNASTSSKAASTGF